MKKGINIWSFPKKLSIKECMELAQKSGFDGIELALSEKGVMSLESSDNEIISYKKMAKDIGIELSSLASGFGWGLPLTCDNEVVREKGMDAVKRLLEAAALLELDTVLVVPGAVGVDFIPGFEVVPYDRAYDNALSAIYKLSDYAKKTGVCIGVENVWNKFLLSPLEMRDFIDKIDSKYIGAYFDVGNVIYSGYPEHWIRILGKRIKKVHFKDYRQSACGLSGFVDLLSGDVNFIEVMKAFKDIGYEGYANAEMGSYKQYPEQMIFNTSKAMDKIFGR